MKTRYWILLFAAVILLCLGAMFFFSPAESAAFAEVYSQGELVTTVCLAVDQQFDVAGHNTVTVRDGRIAVTWADCPDHYCIDRGFCGGGADIVCLPNRLVISFLGEQAIDGVTG